MTRSVKKSINLLQSLYKEGLIPYPRVSNDFEKEPFFEIFPHPPMPVLKDINMPISQSRILINKKSSLLLLSLIKLVKPSKIIHISNKIDAYFDDELNFINTTQENKFHEYQLALEDFLKEKKITEKEILTLANGFYEQKNKEDTFENLNLFHFKNDSFKKTHKSNNEKIPFVYAKKMKEKQLNDKNSEQEYENYFFDNLNQVIDFVKTKNMPIVTSELEYDNR